MRSPVVVPSPRHVVAFAVGSLATHVDVAADPVPALTAAVAIRPSSTARNVLMSTKLHRYAGSRQTATAAARSTESSRPGNRSSSSARRRRMYLLVPCSRAETIPASYSVLKWWLAVDFLTGSST